MDISYLLLLQNFREATNNILTPFFAFITTCGEGFITMLTVAAIYWCIDKKQGMFTLMTWGTGRLLNGFLKLTFCALRPWIRDARIEPAAGAKTTATGYSFPSGHTTNATAVYGSLAMNKKLPKYIRCLMMLLIILVGFSRNYLGVHTPQDVIAGFGSTLALLFFIRWLLEKTEKNPRLDIVVLIAGLAVNLCVIIYSACKSYPVNYDAAGNLIVDPALMAIDTYKGCGFSSAVLISWFVDGRWLHYEAKGSVAARAVYFVLGLAGYAVILFAVLPLLPQNIAGAFFDNFICLIYTMLAVPFFIQLIENKKAAKAKTEENKIQ